MKTNLNIKFSKNTSFVWIKNTYKLRVIIGVLGMLLPILLWFFLYLDSGYTRPLPSISHYYYTRIVGIFMIIIGVMGIFLIIYKGGAEKDFYVSLAAGLSAMLLLLFPTNSIISHFPDSNYAYYNTVLEPSSFREGAHFLFAAVFLGCLAYMSIFIFTMSDKKKKDQTERKRLRNRIYQICGALMIVAMIIIAINPGDMDNLVFWMEVIAVELFGFSWLVKGEALFRDKKAHFAAL